MKYQLPLVRDDELISQIGRDWAREICTPLSDAKHGDVVGVVLPFTRNGLGEMHQAPADDFVLFTPGAGHDEIFERRPVRQMSRERVRELAAQLKMIELTRPAHPGTLLHHTKELFEFIGPDTYALVLTSHAALLYHESYMDWILMNHDLPSAYISQEEADQIIRAIVPGGQTAHEVIDTTTELRHLCRLASDILVLPTDGGPHANFELSNLAPLTSVA
jgi:hypothetical protein